MKYASPEDLADRCDIRVICQLATDSGAAISRSEMASDPVVITAIEDAEAEIESVLRRGGMYRLEDLETLEGAGLAKLKRITCTIAMSFLFERRPGVHADMAKAYFDRSKQILKDLQQGTDTLGLRRNEEAANPTVNGPTSLEYQTLNTIADRMAPRYLPRRETRLPLDRG